MAYFNAKKLPYAKNEYVAFVDMMGTQSRMVNSLNQAGNMIFKLHATVLDALRSGGYKTCSVYPIMDGAYIASPRKEEMQNLLTKIFKNQAQDFIRETKNQHRYLCRGAIAYGQVIHGRDVPYSAAYDFTTRVGYKEQIMIGDAMIRAYKGEDAAPPFGLYLDSSAISNSTDEAEKHGYIRKDWRWFHNNSIMVENDLIQALITETEAYFAWTEEHMPENEYPSASRAHHKQLFMEQFKDWQKQG